MASITSADDFLTVDPKLFTPQMAQGIIQFAISDKLQQRVQVLADKSNEGTITEDERAEYLRYIQFDEVMTLMQAKAKQLLSTDR